MSIQQLLPARPEPLRPVPGKIPPWTPATNVGLGTASTSPCRPHQFLALLCKALGTRLGGIAVFSSERDLIDHFTYGIPAQLTGELDRSGWTEALVQFVLNHSSSVRISKWEEACLSKAMPEDLPKFGPFMGIPLSCQGKCRGIIYLVRDPMSDPFTADDEATSAPIRDALEQGTLLEEARLLSQARILNNLAQAAAGNLEIAPILKVALRELDARLPFHISAVWLLAELEVKPASPKPNDTDPAAEGSEAGEKPQPKLRLAATSASVTDRAERLGLFPGMTLDLSQTPFHECLQTGEALYNDLARPEDCKGQLLETLALRGGRYSFAVPLRAGADSLGFLHCLSTRPAGFTNEQIQLLYLVADLIGPAVSNCQLHGRLRRAYEELSCTQNQLVQAEKMRALGELAGGMAHDFNNSLCGVLGFLELVLAEKNIAPPVKRYLESARTCTLDAAETVRRVQSFARWQRHEFSVQKIDVNALVRETIELTRHKWESLAHARGGAVTAEVLTEANAFLAASPAEIREILTNLVFNAVDAMPHGGRLAVHAWSTEADIYLSVRDSGTGMTEAVRQRLFEPFFTTKGERGNGLGLSVTFGIIQRYGGEIIVESAVGVGSTFVIRLPAAGPEDLAVVAPELAQPTSPSTNSNAHTGPSVRHAPHPPRAEAPRSLRILVIEDEESIRRFLENGLKQLGHLPQISSDASEGLSLFSQGKFDVVLTDLGLPGMSGEEVAKNIHERSPHTPVVLLTGWANQLRDEGRPILGVTRILGKPVSLNSLATTLSAVCHIS